MSKSSGGTRSAAASTPPRLNSGEHIVNGNLKLTPALLSTLPDDKLHALDASVRDEAVGRGIYQRDSNLGKTTLKEGTAAQRLDEARTQIHKEWMRREKLDSQIQTALAKTHKAAQRYAKTGSDSALRAYDKALEKYKKLKAKGN